MNNIVIENARITFRNFSGKEGRFNPAGRRTFSVLLDRDQADRLTEEGWNVKWLQPRDDGEEPQAHIPVEVKWNYMPPKIILITSNGKSSLSEESVNVLDFADIENIDLVLRPYIWEMNGRTGVKAYLKVAYVTLVEDEFENKYRNAPDSAENSIGGCGHCDVCDGSCHCHD